MLDMAERRASQREDWASDLSIRYNLNPEDICEARSAVIPKGAKNEVLALLIEYENT